MSAICNSNVSILLNGERTNSFPPARGICQSDPLSPYIFILCMEFLALTITKASSLGYWKGSKAGRRGPSLSHLFFANDLLFIDHRKLHLVKWEQVSLPKCLDGLGIRSAKEANTTAMVKLNWRLFTKEDKLWNMGLLSEADNNLLVANIFPNGLFDPSLISYPISDCLLDTIKATPISKTMAGQDSFAWNGSPNGSFSTNSAYFLAKGLDPNPKDNCSKTDRCPNMPAPWGTVFTFILWNIWLQRSKKLYSPNSFQPTSIIHTIRERIYEFCAIYPLPKSLPKQVEPRLVGWDKPHVGSFKLNTDGSALGNPEPASAGGIIRDHNGTWVCGFSRKIGTTSALAAELWGVRDGILMAYHYNIQSLIVEMDSLTVVN
ncbi:hypothetical protein SLEP1_g15157 [Rubroshorea leprosula]|uniref:RNase H type-1 domain-containing protein n=1 Tax=Rubroshorea leprosula TaxID=152421 RepID=A0AAV5ILG8_9ROSI|nr:hypothetical protein SLEP1_g15157 [Rubroshorea leprosula]